MYFSKKVSYAVYNGVWGKVPETGEFSRVFVLKVSLRLLKVTFNCKLQKKIGEQDVGLLAPPIILLGEQLLPPAPPVAAFTYTRLV